MPVSRSRRNLISVLAHELVPQRRKKLQDSSWRWGAQVKCSCPASAWSSTRPFRGDTPGEEESGLVAEISSQTSADAFCREAGLEELATHKHLQKVEMRLSNSPSQCQHSQLSKLCSKHGVVESLCRRQQHVPGVFQQYNPFLSFRQPLDGQHLKLPDPDVA